MNKKKFAILALLMVVIMTLTACLLVACNNDSSNGSGNTTIEETKDLLIKNSDFKVIDTKTSSYPRSLTSWTGAKQYSSSNFRDDVTAGVISLVESTYNANKSKWDDQNGEILEKLLADGRYSDDAAVKDDIKNALMIYMPETSKNSSSKDINGPTAYGYTSTSFTLDKGSYYKLSVDVLTYKIGGEEGNDDERGARIYVSSNTYAEFAGIDTKGVWETYEIYIETSPTSTTSLSLMLGLGKYSSYYTKGLTTGYAFFDNVVLEKIVNDEDTAVNDGKVAFENAEEERKSDPTITTTTLKVPNGDFEFGSTTISSSTVPGNWSLVTGNSGKDDPAPTSKGKNAIIDLTKFGENFADYSDKYTVRPLDNTTDQTYTPADRLESIIESIQNYSGRFGNNAFMLSQQEMTAQGIRSSRTITIEKNKVYALSVQLYTYAIHGAGVSLILSGSDGKDIIIEGISATPKEDKVLIGSRTIDIENNSYAGDVDDGESTHGWKTYTFYIKGNQFKDYNYNMTIWLGTKGTSDNTAVTYKNYKNNTNQTTYKANGTFANGWVFIDDLSLKEISVLPKQDNDNTIWEADNTQTLNCFEKGNSYVGLAVDLSTSNIFGDGDNYVLNNSNASNQSSFPEAGIVTSVGVGAPQKWSSSFDINDTSNPIIKDVIEEGIVDLTSENTFKGVAGEALTYPGLPYDMVSKNAYMIHATKNSYYEVETDKITIKANQSYRISLWVKTVDVNSTSGAYIYLIDKSEKDSKDANALISFTKINTDDYDEYLNDWCEITMVVRGASDVDKKVALRFTLGNGTRWAAATLTSGAMFVANLNMSDITYANFNDTTTGTYVKSYDFSTSYSYTFENANFDDYDFDDENLKDGVSLKNQDFAGTPNNWTINDNTIKVNNKDTSLFAGVIALEQKQAPSVEEEGLHYGASHQAITATGISDSVFNNFYKNDNFSDAYLSLIAGAPNVLAIGSKDSEEYAAGFSSGNVTLSANTYYKLSVYVKTVGATTASIFLTGESSATGENTFVIKKNAETDWTIYTFYIETGNTSATVKLNLWLGQDTKYMDISEENAKSAGAVFFDNILYEKIDEDKFNEVEETDTNKVISFITDSFDSLSSSVESRNSLTSPNGWTGAADTNQSSSNSKVGVIYADSNYYDVINVDGVDYAKILGKEYKESDFEVDEDDIAEAKALGKYPNLTTDDEIAAAIKKDKVLESQKANWIPTKQLQAHKLYDYSGDRMLIINNMVKSAYRYTTSSSKTFKENSFYKVAVWVRTYAISGDEDDDTVGANIELYLGSADESDKPFIFTGINTEKKETEDTPYSNEWTKYEFYVKTPKNDDVTSVTIRLSLGKYSSDNIDGENVVKGLTSGYAMFDDVSIEQIDEDAYEAAERAQENDKTIQTRELASTNKGDPNPPVTENPTPSNKFNLDYLWWMIPTIVIGLVIIIVVIVYVVRKLRKPAKKKAVKKASAPVNAEMVDKKRDRYDEGKE